MRPLLRSPTDGARFSREGGAQPRQRPHLKLSGAFAADVPVGPDLPECPRAGAGKAKAGTNDFGFAFGEGVQRRGNVEALARVGAIRGARLEVGAVVSRADLAQRQVCAAVGPSGRGAEDGAEDGGIDVAPE